MKSSQISYEIHVVLVRTIYPLNIGSTSRAMSNMGAKQLHLIQPQCPLNYEAQQMAANGQEGLANHIEYPSWENFYDNNPTGLRVALTARDGRARKPIDLNKGLSELVKIPNIKRSESNKLYLIFGPEDCGLSGVEIDQAHFACCLPTYGPNWSLNLAQAVLLALYIVRDNWGGERTILNGQRPNNLNNKSNSMDLNVTSSSLKKKNIIPEKILYEWIKTLGFELSKRRINAFTVMKRILLHNVPTSKELRVFEAVIQQTIRKLKEKK